MAKNRSIDVVSEDVYNILKTASKEKNRSLRSFANDLLSNIAESDKFLKERFPHLKKIEQDDEKIFIKDKKLGDQTSIVQVKDDRLQCSLCKIDLICDHVTYAIIDPEFWGHSKT